MSEVKEVLTERKAQHGDFSSVAKITSDLLDIMQESKNFDYFHDEEYLALVMILHKVARILCGNPHLKDHWVDIGGYATLVVTTLQEKYARKLHGAAREDDPIRTQDRTFRDGASDGEESQDLDSLRAPVDM